MTDPLQAARRKLDAVEAHLTMVREGLTHVLAETPEQSAARLLKVIALIKADLAAVEAKDALIAHAAAMIEGYASGRVAVVREAAAVVVGPFTPAAAAAHNGHG